MPNRPVTIIGFFIALALIISGVALFFALHHCPSGSSHQHGGCGCCCGGGYGGGIPGNSPIKSGTNPTTITMGPSVIGGNLNNFIIKVTSDGITPGPSNAIKIYANTTIPDPGLTITLSLVSGETLPPGYTLPGPLTVRQGSVLNATILAGLVNVGDMPKHINVAVTGLTGSTWANAMSYPGAPNPPTPPGVSGGYYDGVFTSSSAQFLTIVIGDQAYFF